MDIAHASSLKQTTQGPGRRKSSNLLASLARQNTFTEREKERERERDVNKDEMSTTLHGPNAHTYTHGHSPSLSGMMGLASPNTANGSQQGSTPSSTNAPTAQNTPSSASNFGLALENLRFLLQKRAQTFEYLKRSHEGKVHWFNTILFDRGELDAAFDNVKMTRRTTRFAVLGMSLSVLLEITAAHDFLRGLLSLLQEYETIDDDNFRAKTKNLFKAGRSKRPSGTTDYALNVQESGDLSYLFSPNIIFYTLCDILTEVYTKILTFLGPSATNSNPVAFPGFAQSSYGVSPNIQASQAERRIGVGLSPMLVDVVLKIDGKLKKIIAMVTKELDTLARTAMKEELSYIGDMCLGGNGSSVGF